ncbi:DUF2461 domain-containing protein [Niabella ginsengisoli]|uniref:DUF2461 domain-containing protein n=1 Tax=Niabella ginsengisoli TaxID=522298 RepID=A0ABS9SPN2_9BACT|nr:DUF2461 domain-containing protein [Niabella ginsengisoli]MCH5600358.1 DUF2461 domain-containing protein [Niabella ginsengisoli]
MLQLSTIKFLKALKLNNNKPWFDENRKAYEAARQDFADFIDQVIQTFAKKDPSIAHLKAKDCMFRINRDIRFSKDKTPYKTNFGASINSEGKKSMTAGYYFHLEPGASFTGGGMWQPPADMLAKVRQEIDYGLKDFEKIISSKKFKATYGSLTIEDGQVLMRVPKGYESDNPAAEYLKHKSFIATMNIADSDLTNKTLVTTVYNAFETLQPLNGFLNRALE